MKYMVNLTKWVETEIDANSPNEAIIEARQKFPGYKIDYLHNKDTGETDFPENCNGCGGMILQNETFTCTETGEHYCANCSEAIKGDQPWQFTDPY